MDCVKGSPHPPQDEAGRAQPVGPLPTPKPLPHHWLTEGLSELRSPGAGSAGTAGTSHGYTCRNVLSNYVNFLKLLNFFEHIVLLSVPLRLFVSRVLGWTYRLCLSPSLLDSGLAQPSPAKVGGFTPWKLAPARGTGTVLHIKLTSVLCLQPSHCEQHKTRRDLLPVFKDGCSVQERSPSCHGHTREVPL